MHSVVLLILTTLPLLIMLRFPRVVLKRRNKIGRENWRTCRVPVGAILGKLLVSLADIYLRFSFSWTSFGYWISNESNILFQYIRGWAFIKQPTVERCFQLALIFTFHLTCFASLRKIITGSVSLILRTTSAILNRKPDSR